MRRFVSISWISLFVIVAAVAVLAFAPATRLLLSSAVNDSSEPWLHPPDLKERVRKHPRDAQAWLALAVSAGKPTASGLVDMNALKRAMELKPGWAAPYLVAGSAAISTFKLPMLWRLEVAMAAPGHVANLIRETKPLTSAERKGVRRAREMLQKARALEPDNAAPDYLLAYLALEEHREQDALALLHSGLRKSRWSLGERDTAIALYETALRFTPALYAHIFTMATTSMREFEANERLREIARSDAEMSMLAQQRGDHEEAIFLRESAMHLGRLLMADGYTNFEVLAGSGIWYIGAMQRLTPDEEAAVIAALPAPKSRDEAIGAHERRDALTRAKVAKFAAYLRAHGRADLAAQAVSSGEKLIAWNRNLRKAMHSAFYGPRGFITALTAGMNLVAAAGAAVAWIGACGLAYLLLWLLKRRPVPVVWARWKWAVVAVVSFGLPGAVALGMSHKWAAPFAIAQSGSVPWGLISVAFGLLLLLIVTPVVTWRVRRRVEVSARPGFFRQFVGTLTAVLLPVAAVLLVLLAACAMAQSASATSVVNRLKVSIYQGEPTFMGLQRPLAGQGNRHSRGEYQSPGL